MSMKDEFYGQQWRVSDPHSEKMFIDYVKKLHKESGMITFTWQTGDQRTRKQNNAMWLWLEQIAEALNDAGYDIRATLNKDIELPWNKNRAKEFLWNPVQQALTDQDSSQKLVKPDINLIQETLARHLAKSTGVSVPFPKKME